MQSLKYLQTDHNYIDPKLPKVFSATLDFHDRGALDLYQIEKILTEFLEDNYYANKQNLLVVTGKGRIVRPLVFRLLSQHKLVKSFQPAGYFTGQQGAFEVVLNS